MEFPNKQDCTARFPVRLEKPFTLLKTLQSVCYSAMMRRRTAVRQRCCPVHHSQSPGLVLGSRPPPRVSSSTKCFVLNVARATDQIKPSPTTFGFLRFHGGENLPGNPLRGPTGAVNIQTKEGENPKGREEGLNPDPGRTTAPPSDLLAPTRRWSPDWCRRRSCRTGSR